MLNERQQQELLTLVNKYRRSFAVYMGELGSTLLEEMDIQTRNGAQPGFWSNHTVRHG